MERNMLGEKLSHVKFTWGNRGVVEGDFNIILRRSDRLGNCFSDTGIDEFHSLIHNLDLNDLPLKGGRWTRSNK